MATLVCEFEQTDLIAIPKLLPDCDSKNHLVDRNCKATTKGFEPSRAEPNGFRVHLLNHSDTLSCMQAGRRHFETKHFDARPTTCYEHNALHILVPPHGGTKNVLHVLVTTFARSKGRGRRGRGGKERGWQGWQGCGGRSPRETVYNVYDSKGCDAKQ